MRRLILMVVFCFATGLILSVGVAWGCAWWHPKPVWDDGLPFVKDATNQPWLLSRINGFGWTAVRLFGSDLEPSLPEDPGNPLPTWIELPSSPPNLIHRATGAHATGWPALCLKTQRHGVASYEPVNNVLFTGLGPQSVTWDDWQGLLLERENITTMSQPHLVPWHPIWRGLMINTLVWSTPALLLVVLVEARRRSRSRHGRCIDCGYPATTGSSACSECGHVLVKTEA